MTTSTYSDTEMSTTQTRNAVRTARSRIGRPARDAQPTRRDLPAALGRGHRRHREAGQRRPDRALEPDQQPLRRHRAARSTRNATTSSACAPIRRSPTPERISTWPSSSRRRRPSRASWPSAPRPACKGAIIISAGFRETGADGAALEQQVVKIAREAGIRVVGPNCLGVMNPVHGLNATFAAGMAAAGTVGFVSQSGALLTAVLDWSAERGSRILERRLARLDGRRGLGRRHRLPGRRPAHRLRS